MILQPVIDIAEICARKGIKTAIICPGSRNAPLTIAFARHPKIDCLSVPDERSAAFIGLGIALKTNQTVALICTSGSAAYNFAPAVAEAYFSNIPLLVLTADRPTEWIGQLDGQTIFQENVYGKHVKKSFNFPTNYLHKDSIWHANRMADQAINISQEFPQGPVHINVPLREPFYPEPEEHLSYSKDLKISDNQHIEYNQINLAQILDTSSVSKILVIAGQTARNAELEETLTKISNKLGIPIIADIISNNHEVDGVITTQDAFLRNKDRYEELKPDLIISFGLSVISKNLKLFLRQVRPLEHWHIQQAGEVADTFKSLTRTWRCTPESFFRALLNYDNPNIDPEFDSKWKLDHKRALSAVKKGLSESTEFNEFNAFQYVMEELPNHVDLHLANSMAVRYANFLGLSNKTGIEVFANRGTSGIDGSNSTAVGCAISTDRDVYLLTGDMAFLYDRNAFWHNHVPPNLKVIVFNNHGGGIFRMIDGPSKQQELEEFFETRQHLTAKSLCQEFGFNYFCCQNEEQLEVGLTKLTSSSGRPFVLEIETDAKTNQKVYKQVMGTLSQFN